MQLLTENLDIRDPALDATECLDVSAPRLRPRTLRDPLEDADPNGSFGTTGRPSVTCDSWDSTVCMPELSDKLITGVVVGRGGVFRPFACDKLDELGE